MRSVHLRFPSVAQKRRLLKLSIAKLHFLIQQPFWRIIFVQRNKKKKEKVLERHFDNSLSSLNLTAAFPLLYRKTLCLPRFFSKGQTVLFGAANMSQPKSPSQRFSAVMSSLKVFITWNKRQCAANFQQLADILKDAGFSVVIRSSQGDFSKFSFRKKSVASLDFGTLKIIGGFNNGVPLDEYSCTFTWWNHERK